LLTAIAAATDALTYLRLDVFPANMTGNTVLIAIGIASHEWHAAALSAAALAAFVCGAAIAGATGARAPVRRFLVAALTIECALLVIGAFVWRDVSDGGPGRYALIAALGAAMGLQSATVTQLHVGVSTTYITGTWTAVSRFAATRRATATRPSDGKEPPHRLQAAVVGCYFCAALVAASLYQWSR
jgi:uncharacterized membrane protein YoaK (UPF0700 family)